MTKRELYIRWSGPFLTGFSKEIQEAAEKCFYKDLEKWYLDKQERELVEIKEKLFAEQEKGFYIETFNKNKCYDCYD